MEWDGGLKAHETRAQLTSRAEEVAAASNIQQARQNSTAPGKGFVRSSLVTRHSSGAGWDAQRRVVLAAALHGRITAARALPRTCEKLAVDWRASSCYVLIRDAGWTWRRLLLVLAVLGDGLRSGGVAVDSNAIRPHTIMHLGSLACWATWVPGLLDSTRADCSEGPQRPCACRRAAGDNWEICYDCAIVRLRGRGRECECVCGVSRRGTERGAAERAMRFLNLCWGNWKRDHSYSCSALRCFLVPSGADKTNKHLGRQGLPRPIS
ncbi:hypothetical protein B0T25DRAFT_316763 [Lasiosphaeria hispida]|uniref:Uncharacterized protein n=1 Tax=Lasiosphaeria hispida TaxID=260671 RepID=A0AAJ0H937_9PEZI|nr:hypothetical protein B0T25DRAFT_316763 [Lasiosphaeria hispida]